MNLNLLEQRAQELSVATRIADGAKAQGRDEFTSAELALLDDAMAKVEALDTKIKAGQEGADLRAKLGRLEPDSGETGMVLGLSDRKSFAAAIMRNMVQQGKSLAATGTVVTTINLVPDPIALGRIPSSLTDALVAVKHPDPAYSYLVQTVRTNNAAPVADLALKPTTVLNLVRVDAQLAVIAHVTEAIPRFWVSDNTGLQTFIANDLLYGLGTALENQILNGTGTAPSCRGILNTVGIQLQSAVGTDVLGTIRTAITKVAIAGQVAGLIVVHPTDWQRIETVRTVTGGALEMVPNASPVNSATQSLWGVPVVTTTALAAGTAIVLDRSVVAVDSHAAGVEIEWTAAVSDDFLKNAVRCRAEGRFGVSIYQPSGVIKVTLP